MAPQLWHSSALGIRGSSELLGYVLPLLKAIPIASRGRYHTVWMPHTAANSPPSNTDELHGIAGTLMSSRRSETLGWQLLFESMTGLRTEETLALRMDARADEPGGLTPDGESMCVRRGKSPRNSAIMFASMKASSW